MADYATLVFDIDSTQARGAAKALGDLNSAAIKAANGSARLLGMQRDARGQFQSNARYAAENSREIERLAASYNPVLSAQIAYRNEVIQTSAAVRLGVIDEQQRVDILQRTRAAMDAAAGAAGRFGQSQQVATHHVSNLSFQLNDIGMMMASGQNPFMLMIQQGPQVAQIFGQMNAEGRNIGPTLAGAFRMFLNPTTLVTLALIGGSAALAQWGMSALSAGKDSRSFSDSLDSALDNISKIAAANKSLSSKGVEELGTKYGMVTAEVRGLIEAQRDLATQSAQADFNQATDKLRSSLQGGWLASAFDNGRIAITASEKEAVKLDQTVNHLQRTLRINEDSARGMAETLSQAFNEKDPQEYARLVAHVRNYVLQVAAAGGDGAKAARLLAEELTKSEDAARQLNAQAGNMPAAFSAAASAASRITDELNRAVSAAARLAASAISDVRFAQIELDFRTDAVGKAGAIAAAKFDEEVGKNIGMDAHIFNSMRNKAIEGAKEAARIQGEVQRLNDADREAERQAKKDASAAASAAKAAEKKSAAELKAAEKGFQSLRELLEKESLFQFAEYEKRQLQLDTALKNQLLTRQEYDEYQKQLRINYFGTEYQQQQLRYDLEHQQLKDALEKQKITREEYAAIERQNQWRQFSELGSIRDTGVAYDLSKLAEGFGQAASMAGDYNAKFLKAQRVFAASAALISTYQGAAKALELPFPMNIAAAAKVLAAGMGFISAIKSGSSSGGGGGGGSSSAGSVKQEPTKNVLIRLEGDDWLTGLAEQMMTQIYEASSNGRVIVSRDNS